MEFRYFDWPRQTSDVPINLEEQTMFSDTPIVRFQLTQRRHHFRQNQLWLLNIREGTSFSITFHWFHKDIINNCRPESCATADYLLLYLLLSTLLAIPSLASVLCQHFCQSTIRFVGWSEHYRRIFQSASVLFLWWYSKFLVRLRRMKKLTRHRVWRTL